MSNNEIFMKSISRIFLSETSFYLIKLLDKVKLILHTIKKIREIDFKFCNFIFFTEIFIILTMAMSDLYSKSKLRTLAIMKHGNKGHSLLHIENCK